MTVVVLGIDPGFAALGVARVRLLPLAEVVEELAVIRTEPSPRKRGVRSTEDTVERMRALTRALDRRLDDVSVICTEAQSWPRNAGAVAKVGMAWGILVALAHLRGLPILQVSPMQLKRAVVGAKTASKEEVQTALELRYPELPDWPAHREHAADALGAVVACLEDDRLLALRRAVA